MQFDFGQLIDTIRAGIGAVPPVIVAIVLLGVLFGGLGIILAVPLAAAGMVAVNMLYLEDFLGEGRGNG